VATVLGLVATIAVAACGGGSSTSVNKTTATFAEGQGANPNYIFPLAPLKYFSVANLSQFQYLMYRPLYWFGQNGQVTLNNSLSLANPPQYSSDGKTVTMTMKNYQWSNGEKVNAKDVLFWMDLLKANTSDWAAYDPGEFPDNVTKMSVSSDDSSITFTLSQTYGSYFFTYNELSQITPLPLAWAKTSDSGTTIDPATMTTAQAKAVYTYLSTKASSISTYATDPLWQIVDGPWKLKSMDTTGNVVMVPNTMYSGPVKPRLSEFKEVPFTKDTAEFDQLKAGTSAANAIDYGYLPPEDVPQKNSITALGYTFAPWTGWQVVYFPENFTNPTSGPIFKQDYFRQAMQMLVDQNTYIQKAFFNEAYPTYGPVPVKPASQFTDSTEQSNPLPFNPSAAVSLLQSHGWTVNPGGVSTCTSPGSGSNQCGPGVPAGAQASFHLEYISGTPSVDAEMARFKTDFSKAGIQINLSTNTFDTVIGNAVPCTPGKACNWDMEFWGGGWIYAPDYYPTGDELWATGAGSNSGGYSDPTADSLIQATETSNNVQAMYAYEDYFAKNPPVIWMPTPYAQISMINSHLQGAMPQDPLLQIYPENWYWQ
jgi:peptide/nickel transport system substrate-binding protein